KVKMSSTGSSLPLTALSFTPTGSNNVSTNLQNAKIFFTGSSSTFATTTQFGTTISSISTGNNRVTGNVGLVNDTNYFWLTFDVKSAATRVDTIDATIDTVTVNGTANAVSPITVTGYSLVGPLKPVFTATLSTGIAYTSIMATGNTYSSWVGASGDDNTTSSVSMPFNFFYLGNKVTSFVQCTNGWMSLNGGAVTSTAFTNSITGNGTTINSVLAPIWDDLVMTGQNFSNANSCMRYKVDTITSSPLARVLIVEWAGMERFNQSSPNLNFQVRLYEGSNNIEYRYGEMTGFTGSSAITYTATVGMNSALTSTLSSGDYMNLLQSRTDKFSNSSAQNSLSWLPECNSSYLFTAGAIGSGTNYPVITNNECSGAIGINVSNTAATASCQNFRTFGATASSSIPTCSAGTPGTPDDDVWFTFNNAQTQDVTIEVAGSNGFDPVVQLFSGTCGSLTAINCVNATSTGGLEAFTSSALASGTYYVRIYHSGTGYSSATSDSGVFNLNIYAVPPPANDNCSGAYQLTVNGTSCSTSRTDTLAAATASSQTVCTGTASKDVWYYFVATAAGHDVTVTPGNVAFNGVIQVFSLGSSYDCNNAVTGNQIACGNSTGANTNEVVNLTGLTPGNYYAVRVYHFLGGAGGNGKFTICVTTPPATVGTITATQQTGSAYANSTNVPIMLINIPVSGGQGTQTLNSITVTAANTSNSDVTSVKLWSTSGNTFTSPTQLGSTQTFGGGTATFSSLGYAISGTANLWVTYNISGSPTLGNVLDLSIASGDITITSSGGATAAGTQPASALNPTGNVVVDILLDYNITRTTGNTFSSIMTTGNAFGFTGSSGDDQTSPAITMPFTFTYMGQTVSSFKACTNGWMTLNGANVTSSTFTNSIAGNSSTQNAILAPFWDDLVTTGYPTGYTSGSNLNVSMKYKVTGSSPNQVLTVEWAGMERFNSPGPNLNFQVKLYETSNKIQFVYGEMSLFDGTTINDYSYSVGMNSFTTATAGNGQFLSLQQANSDVFASTAVDNLFTGIACNTMYEFTTGTHGAGTAAAAITNDECSGAIGLSVGTDAPSDYCEAYRTEGATASTGIPTCGAVTPGNADDDVWFSFTIGSTKSVQVDLRSAPQFDGVFQVFSGTCGSLSSLACINKTGASLTEDTILYNLSAGTYYIRVYHSGTGSSNLAAAKGDFAIYVYDAPIAPTNDNISGATALTSGNTCVLSATQKTTYATGSSQTVCTGTASKDVWYTFQAGYSAHTVTVTPVTPGVTFNPVVQIFDLGTTIDTANAISGNQVACQNNVGTNQSEVVNLTTLVPTHYYAVRVYHALGGAGGTGKFKICVANPVGFWSGNTSSAWNVASNWSDGSVPTASTNVRIEGGRPNYPVLSSSVQANAFQIDNAASITLNTGATLNINGAVTYNTGSTWTNNSGTVVLNAATNVPNITYNALKLMASTGTYTMMGDATINNVFTIGGASTLATAGFTIDCKSDINNNGTVNGTGKIVSSRASGYATLNGTSTSNYNNIEINTSVAGGARIINNTQINGTLILTQGTLILNNGANVVVGSTSTSTGNITTTANASILAGNSATDASLSILGNSSATQITNLKMAIGGSFTLNRPNGVSLGSACNVGKGFNLLQGTLNQNGFNLNLGTLSTANLLVNDSLGTINNGGATGSLNIYGNVSAASIVNLRLDSVNQMVVNLPAGISLGSNFYVRTSASLTKGDINLNGKVVTLGTSGSITEAAGQNFYGTTGSITTTRTFASNLSNLNVGGMGLKMTTTSAPGSTTIRRAHNVYTNGGGSSIKRNYTVTVGSAVTASYFEMNYDSTELNGANRSKLRINKSTNSGSTWSNISNCSPTSANNATGYVSKTNVALTGTILFTTSDSVNSSLSPVFVQQTTVNAAMTSLNSINSVYPNPFTEQVTVDFNSANTGLATIRLTDINGKVVYQSNLSTVEGKNIANINGTQLSSGLYIITIMNGDDVKTSRIIKQ
ncbi:MAG: T9SS type A sorting domain-containing protein, partial [Bacteroidetes bacterium]|nr:T9SS type A sorting domain-containing protein [Bacteroidota bacterium]